MAAEGHGFEDALAYYAHLMEDGASALEKLWPCAGRRNREVDDIEEKPELKQAYELGKSICKIKERNIMEKIKLPQAAQLTSPNPVTVICTQKPDGSTNLTTVSWWTYPSFNPDMIIYVMAKTFYSGEMVRSSRKVILTILGTGVAETVMGCGSTTGRDTDKAAKFGIELAEVEGSSIKIPVHSRVAIVCSMNFLATLFISRYFCVVNSFFQNFQSKNNPAFIFKMFV